LENKINDNEHENLLLKNKIMEKESELQAIKEQLEKEKKYD